MNNSVVDKEISPFRHLSIKSMGHSPIELKDKLRKNYRSKVMNRRRDLFNQLRGPQMEDHLRDSLTEIFKSLVGFSSHMTVEEEHAVLNEIEHELIQNEYDWWLTEYSKSQLEDVDWFYVENDNNIICPLCEKENLSLNFGNLSCNHCEFSIKTKASVDDIKNTLSNIINSHSKSCNDKGNFLVVQESNEPHIYFICDNCLEMQLFY